MNMRKKFLMREIVPSVVCLILVAFMWIVAGCAETKVGKGFDVLHTGAVLYDTGLTYAGEEYRAGRISDAQKDVIIGYAKKYKVAWWAAKDALVTYQKAIRMRGSDSDLSTEELALQVATDAARAAQRLLVDYMALLSKGG